MTEIKCPMCKGTKMHPKLKNVPCGACFNTGLSTISYDQKSNGTTIGKKVGDSPKGYRVINPGRATSDYFGKPIIVGILVEWDNPDYEKRLALDKQGLLYP